MFIKNGKRINIHAPFETEDGTRYAFVPAGMYAELGIDEVPEPQPPEDYSDELYFRVEQDDAPYVVYTRKPDEMVAQARQTKILAQIDSLERDQQLPRLVRDSLFRQFEREATDLGMTLQQVYDAATQPDPPTAAITYKKLKDFDTQIAELRSQL